MTKIFISHATVNGTIATKIMDMLQTQFNLKRENFFLTSDEELEVGGNWIEEIREGVKDASIIMPLITPSFMESQFCLCELGAAWVNQQALVPVIIPPLNHNALAETPYGSWLQAITLNSTDDLLRLADAMASRGAGSVKYARFFKRAEEFYKEALTPFIRKMEEKESITPAAVKVLRVENKSIKEAYDQAEDEVKNLRMENKALRKMKDADNVKELEYSQMDEWDEFTSTVKNAKTQLNILSTLTTSVLYHNSKSTSYNGFIGDQADFQELKKLESEGFIQWDEGWVPDYDHSAIERTNQSLIELKDVINITMDNIQERFDEEYKDVRLGLEYSTFWEKVLRQKIRHSNR